MSDTGHRRQRARPVPVLMALWALPVLLSCQDRAAPDMEDTGLMQGEPERGRRLLAQYQCSSCHAIPEVPGPQGGMGPSLAAFGKRSYIAGHVPNGPASLPAWIQDPQVLAPGTAMPDLGVSAEDARDMAAYLLSLR